MKRDGWEDWTPRLRDEIVEELVEAFLKLRLFPKQFSQTELRTAQQKCGIRTWPQVTHSHFLEDERYVSR